VIGILHPGQMGSAVGAVLRGRGHEVAWASDGRSGETARRAAEAGLGDLGTAGALAERCEILLSICPPHAALDVARSLVGYGGIYVDANAVSPATAREIGALFGRYVDGGIVGGPPRDPGGTRLYLAGAEAEAIGSLFRGSALEPVVLQAPIGSASALKMAYAAWTKGSAALLLAVRATARAHGVEEGLLEEWRSSLPGLEDRAARAERSAATKGWRWVGEMEEIAATFGAAGEPEGFHRAAADVFRRYA
jgi:3-hydroxyisobutyrate dehydrogenase-like beta-hydroxyacid dehydrogenase